MAKRLGEDRGAPNPMQQTMGIPDDALYGRQAPSENGVDYRSTQQVLQAKSDPVMAQRMAAMRGYDGPDPMLQTMGIPDSALYGDSGASRPRMRLGCEERKNDPDARKAYVAERVMGADGVDPKVVAKMPPVHLEQSHGKELLTTVADGRMYMSSDYGENFRHVPLGDYGNIDKNAKVPSFEDAYRKTYEGKAEELAKANKAVEDAVNKAQNLSNGPAPEDTKDYGG